MQPALFIRRARERRGLSQAALARSAGTSQPVISAYESGARVPSMATLRRIASALGERPSEALAAHRAEVLELCERFGSRNVRVFGSIARGEDDPYSDVDLLVDPSPRTSARRRDG